MKYNKLKNFLFEKKKLIIISENGITTKKSGNFGNIVGLCFVVWSVFASFFYFKNQEIIKSKNKQIEELSFVNNELNDNIHDLTELFDNIKSYMYSLNLYDRFDKIEIGSLDKNLNIVNNKFLDSKAYKNVLPMLAKIEDETETIDNLLNSRIYNIENLVESTGVNKNILENIHTVSYETKNDYITNEYLVSKVSPIKKNKFKDINDKISYLNYLESFVNSMPISNPMNNYRITSRFGDRPDPFEKNSRFHRGIDLAGPINANVIATADGEVIYASKNSGYGNYVKLRHKNSITTEYAHLKNIKVKVGDFVKRGDTLGLQGNTGRSKGAHLHYEIKVNNKVQDPRNFMDVGNKIF